MIGLPKPRTRKSVKRKNTRQARAVVQSVRAQCVNRDMYCRVMTDAWLSMQTMYVWAASNCNGQSEWAHLGNQKRFKTRGKPPEERHTTAGSLMLCRFHHRAYDRGKLRIIGTDANQPLRFEWNE